MSLATYRQFPRGGLPSPFRRPPLRIPANHAPFRARGTSAARAIINTYANDRNWSSYAVSPFRGSRMASRYGAPMFWAADFLFTTGATHYFWTEPFRTQASGWWENECGLRHDSPYYQAFPSCGGQWTDTTNLSEGFYTPKIYPSGMAEWGYVQVDPYVSWLPNYHIIQPAYGLHIDAELGPAFYPRWVEVPGTPTEPGHLPHLQERPSTQQSIRTYPRMSRQSAQDQALAAPPNGRPPQWPDDEWTREKKVRASSSRLRALRFAVESAYEGVEVIDYLCSATKGCRRKWTTVRKTQYIGENLSKVDVAKFIRNLVYGELITDRIYATIGKASAEAGRRIGQPTGLMSWNFRWATNSHYENFYNGTY